MGISMMFIFMFEFISVSESLFVMSPRKLNLFLSLSESESVLLTPSQLFGLSFFTYMISTTSANSS